MDSVSPPQPTPSPPSRVSPLSPSQVLHLASASCRPLIKMQGTLFGRPAVFLLDSGATGNFVSSAFVRAHNLPFLTAVSSGPRHSGRRQPTVRGLHRAVGCGSHFVVFGFARSRLPDPPRLRCHSGHAVAGAGQPRGQLAAAHRHSPRPARSSPRVGVASAVAGRTVVVVVGRVVVATRQLIGAAVLTLVAKFVTFAFATCGCIRWA